MLMLSGTAICWMFPTFLINLFSQDPQVIHYGVIYLKIVSLANVAVDTILTVSTDYSSNK